MKALIRLTRYLALASFAVPAIAQASQGPGVEPGTASAFTQAAMAIAVYGGAGVIVAVALIGSMRRAR